MTFDAKAFAQAGYEVVPSANGGIILAGEEQNLAFTTPADFVEWLRDVHGLKSQEDLMEPYVTPVGLASEAGQLVRSPAKMYFYTKATGWVESVSHLKSGQ